MALDKGRLEEIATAIALMYDPEVYSKLKTEINKPMADIPAGHALNINWDNIVNSYKVIKDFLKETLYKEDMSMENIGSKLVQRGTNGGIKVGDIYTTTPLNNGAIASNSGIAYKDSDGMLKYTNNFAEFRKLTNTISKDEMNIVEKLDINGTFDIYGTSRVITLNEKAKNYKVLMIKAAGTTEDIHFLLMIPGQRVTSRDGTRYGGGAISALWNGGLQVTVNHYPGPKDGYSGKVEGVWGLI
ncbi:hypothetical protein [Fusobacterium varium]|jgi:hypothetical protein|uniref:hypothetical protein n=1 Tax=Fusobacterium varium TaxID=856 RepID=UPI0021C2F0CE|nr:hypothetical protein [Fusobacterium varium]MCI6033164.1 hypothetical protein [Fusobacterium varium]MDY4004708.1 hypothetical protein [Fusobacterium varium]